MKRLYIQHLRQALVLVDVQASASFVVAADDILSFAERGLF